MKALIYLAIAALTIAVGCWDVLKLQSHYYAISGCGLLVLGGMNLWISIYSMLKGE